MHTLGSASYLDASRYSEEMTVDETIKKLTRYNGLLQDTFHDLYETVRSFFEKEFGFDCSYSQNLAYPGFHIFNSSQSYSLQANHEPHFDGQYQTFMKVLGIEDVTSKQLLSFTLPIALPHNGGGLRMWDWTYDDNKEKSKEEIISGIKDSKMVNIEYNEGEIIWHSGLNLHQIKSWQSSEKSESRITLQGHGFLIEKTMFLYW